MLMKKKLFYTAISVISMIAIFNVGAVKKESGDIGLQNIETLSSGETGGSINCFFIGNLDCPGSGAKVSFIW